MFDQYGLKLQIEILVDECIRLLKENGELRRENITLRYKLFCLSFKEAKENHVK